MIFRLFIILVAVNSSWAGSSLEFTKLKSSSSAALDCLFTMKSAATADRYEGRVRISVLGDSQFALKMNDQRIMECPMQIRSAETTQIDGMMEIVLERDKPCESKIAEILEKRLARTTKLFIQKTTVQIQFLTLEGLHNCKTTKLEFQGLAQLLRKYDKRDH